LRAAFAFAAAAAVPLASMGAPAAGQAAPAATQADAPSLSREQVDQLLTAPDRVTFIDVRRADEIAATGSVPAYLNIPASEIDRFLAYIPRDRQVVTISNRAGRAKRTAAILAAQGYQVAGVFGVVDYAEAGGTLYGKTFLTPGIAGLVEPGKRIEVIREGFRGTEGPVLLGDGSIVFTENQADRLVRIAPDNTVAPLLEKTGGANALAVGRDGRLLAVLTGQPGVAELQPARKVLASAYGKKPFSRPNDLVLARTGHIYFTDPGAPPAAGSPRSSEVNTGLYWLDPKGRVKLLASDIPRPNGVALSPDEKTLYVADSWGETLLAYTIQPDGSPTDRRPFAKLAGFRITGDGPTSGADGIAVDAEGRVLVATLAGIEAFSPDGSPLGVIALPKQPQNLAFGGPDRSHLYVVGRGSAYRIPTLTRGVDRPGK
jgi:gluconolactonase